MEAWRAPTGAQFPRISLGDFRVVRYQNLAHNRDSERQLVTDDVFSAYFKQIVEAINSMESVISPRNSLRLKIKDAW